MKEFRAPVCAEARQGGHIDHAARIIAAKPIEDRLLDGDKLALYLNLISVFVG